MAPGGERKTESAEAGKLVRVRWDLQGSPFTWHVGLPVGIAALVHLAGRIAYRGGYMELYTADGCTVFGLVLMVMSATLVMNRVYRMTPITYATLAAGVCILVGQALNVVDHSPAWGAEATEVAVNSARTFFKDTCFVVGIALLFSVYLMSLFESNRARVSLADSYADVERQVNERTASLVEANEKLGLENRVRCEAEDALRLSEEKFRALVENSADIILRFDKDLRILYANPTALAATGKQGDELTGWPVAVLLGSSRSADAWQGAARQVISSGKPGRVATSLGDSAAFQLLDWSLSPETDAAGQVMSLLTVARDMTGLWRKEMERRALEEQLFQSQKLESVGRLAGGIAHDFNNLLQVISGYLEIALAEIEPEHRAHARLRHVDKAALRATSLVRQLLAFSRRETMRCEYVDLSRLVLDMAKMLQRVLGGQYEISIADPPELPLIYADAGHMEQVLMNLCLNARDAMPGGGTIRIEMRTVRISEDTPGLHPDCPPGDYVETMVSDTGMGMAPELLSQIFEPFFTTKETGKGTGLGLSVAYGIVRQHGGFLNVESSPGMGSTFSIFLSAAPEAADKATVAESPPPPSLGTGETILLAEDDKLVRDLTGNILERAGYRVIGASDGVEAVNIVKNGCAGIDLFILDVVMPRKSGREVCEAVLALRADAKILFVTGQSANALTEINLPQGEYNLLHKPFSANDLLARIRLILDGSHTA